jgi:hypothetical protein
MQNAYAGYPDKHAVNDMAINAQTEKVQGKGMLCP